MGDLSSYVADEVLDHIFGTGAVYTPETNLYIALLKSTPDADNTGSDIPSEITGAGYARKVCNTWAAATGDPAATENTGPITFAQATADWGIVTHFAIVAKLTTGEMIAWGKLSVARTISSGDTARFATGELDVTLGSAVA